MKRGYYRKVSVRILILIVFFSFSGYSQLIKTELFNYRGDTIHACDCNFENRDKIIKAKVWIPKAAFQFDKIYIDLVKKGLFSYKRERDGDSYLSFTKQELEAALRGNSYLEVELSYFTYCGDKSYDMYIMVFGDMITGYKKVEENGKMVKTAVYAGGTGKELGKSVVIKTSILK